MNRPFSEPSTALVQDWFNGSSRSPPAEQAMLKFLEAAAFVFMAATVIASTVATVLLS